MIKKIVYSKWWWFSLTTSLFLFISLSIYAISQFYTTTQYWKEQFIVANTQYIVKFKNEKIVLTDKMKQWLSNKNVYENKYYRAVIKGYGSHAELLQAGGLIIPSVKHFYVSNKQFEIQGNILKINDNIFCGNWQLINISAEEYIYYLHK